MNCTSEIWIDARQRLEEEIPSFAFASWIAPLAVKVAPSQIALGCPSSFHRDHVRIVYGEALQRVLRAAFAAARESSDPSASVGPNPSEKLAAPALTPGTGSAPIEYMLSSQLADMPGHLIGITQDAPDAQGEPGDAATCLRHQARQMRKVEASLSSSSLSAQPLAVAEGAGAGAVQSLGTSTSSGPQARSTASPVAPNALQAGQAGSSFFTSAPLSTPLSAPFSLQTFESSEPARPGFESGSAVSPPKKSKTKGQASAGDFSAKQTPGPSAPQQRHRPAGPLRDEAAQQKLPFSFDNFVVGPCNALAREAALALARRHQSGLKLLYLEGDSGLGKTHIARATAEAAKLGDPAAQHQHLSGGMQSSARSLDRGYNGPPRQQSPLQNYSRGASQSVVYTSAEEFTTEFVSSIRNGRADSFRKRFRGATSLLVVEDIQFFSGRSKTQLELFHTIQHLLDTGGRVLLTGDRSPRELTGLDERVRSQVAQGFIAELEPPDALVRRHILRSKAAGGGVRLPEDCLNLLVEASQGSVRDIEGMLIQVVTTSSLLGRPIDAALTQEAIDLKTSVGSTLTKKTVAVTEIVRIVASFFAKKPEALASRSRRRDVLLPRQLAMYLANRYTEASLSEIGHALGRKHPSVRNAIEQIDRQVLEHAPVRYKLEALCERIDRTLDLRTEPGAEASSEPTQKST